MNFASKKAYISKRKTQQEEAHNKNVDLLSEIQKADSERSISDEELDSFQEEAKDSY